MKYIKEKIKNWAAEEKFNAVGFTQIGEIPANVKDHFIKWKGSGYAGDMDWFNKTINERLKVEKYFPEAKNAIVFLHSYYHQVSDEWEKEKFKIASYAHGKDYHKLLRKKTGRIAQKMQNEFGKFEYKISVDSSPVLERYWAQKAGLGWIGKNSMLISPQIGSYTFIAVLLTNLEIEPDTSFIKDYCGNCNKCVEACPTGAILPDKIIDSNKCLSYLTIEHKKEIAVDLLDKVKPWLFGCDVCLNVCPWNTKAVETKELRFHQSYSTGEIKDLINDFSETKFNDCFAGTPIRRAGAQHFIYIADLIMKE
ncbi:MAG: tRNA epoxyqueuosine(34) reductase QueG [Calditrichia bacterium]|nr:tRNA epoxyqueuosine(34) reductase QueG [Calditrichia bacterium]